MNGGTMDSLRLAEIRLRDTMCEDSPINLGMHALDVAVRVTAARRKTLARRYIASAQRRIALANRMVR